MKNKNIDNSNDKIELANKIASQKKRVSDSYSNFENNLFRFFKWFSTLFDQVIFNNRYAPLVALGLALILYFSVNYNSDSSIFARRTSNAKELNGVPINARYNSESFEISGVPESCDVTIIGQASDVNNAATKKGYCLLNLEGYVEGTHQIKVSALGFGDNVNVKAYPSDITVILKKKTTRQFAIGYDFINTDKLESKYNLANPVFDNSRVNIRASQDTLDSIAYVKALINVEGVTKDFTQEASLVAYNKQGQPVQADIVPNKVSVSVKVTSPNKTVPVVLNVTGAVPNNMAINSIYMDHQTVVVYAPESELVNISYVSVNIDASTLTKDTKIVQPIALPNGASSSDITKVNLDIKLGEKASTTVAKVPITYQNHNGSLSLKVANNQTTVDVIVAGTKDNIETISANDINVYFDLKGLKAGTHDLPLQIGKSSNPYVTYSLSQKTIRVTLTSTEEGE